MNLAFAREVGLLRYLWRRVWWRIKPPTRIDLATGVSFPLPREKFFASDVYVTQGNVDWNAEYILAAYLKQRTPGGDFLEVGAHIGYYSALLSPFVRRIYAFEPDARNHPYLRETLSSLPSAKLIPQAVCDRVGRMNLSNDSESSLSHLDPNSAEGTNMVDTTTIDAFVQMHQTQPAAIKVDIEGFDILALRGALETIRQFHPVFLVEYGQDANAANTWEALDAFLRESGCSLYVISSVPRSGFSGYNYTFAKRSVDETRRLNTKMLFVVPAPEEAWFATFAQNRGRWTSKALRPEAVRAFLAE